VECEPCIYGKGRLGRRSLSFLYGEIMEGWKKSYMLERRTIQGNV
jgi:hypothetical protein